MKRRTFLAGAISALPTLAAAGVIPKAPPLPFMPPLPHDSNASSDILIGEVAPFSGPQAHYGASLSAGIEAVFKQINDAGGIRGRRLRLLKADDQFDPRRTVAAYDSLAQQGVVAFCGNFGTPTTLAALPWIASHQIPVVGVYSGSSALRTPVNPYIFNLRGSLVDESRDIKRTLDAQGIDKVAVLYEDDAYGAAGLEALRSVYGKGGVYALPLAVNATVASTQSAVQRLLTTNPQVVILVLTTQVGARAITELRAAGFGGPMQQIVAISGIGPSAIARALPAADRPNLLVSTVVPYPFGGGSNALLSLAYRNSMIASGSSAQIGFSSMEGYIDAKVLVHALRHATALTSAGIVSALNQMGTFDLGGDVGGLRLTLSKDNHAATSFANLVSLRGDGTYRND